MMELFIFGDGSIRCLYGEDIELNCLGPLRISRASHIEPDSAGRWWADCSPVGGPKLGPHILRSDAIAAEIEWLNQHRLGGWNARLARIGTSSFDPMDNARP